MKAIVLSAGDELILGQTIDTNSAWISARLVEHGSVPLYHKTVGDSAEAIRRAIVEASDDADLVVLTGGLGPTDDDLSRQALSAALGKPLVLHEPSLAVIQEFFRKLGRSMPEQNRIQAMHPQGTRMLPNPWGTAPGIEAERKDCRIFLFPGVPREMRGMWEMHLLPWLSRQTGNHVVLASVTTFGAGESTIATALGDLMDRRRNPTVGTTVSAAEVTVRIRAVFPQRETAFQAMEQTLGAVKERIGDWVVSTSGGSLVETTADLLRKGGKRVATAESCTGGLIGKLLTDSQGSSEFFAGGWIVYSNGLKERLLGVKPGLIEREGAVSEAVAAEMALGALEQSGADYTLAVSGIAGPGGGSTEKTVGTVWIALAAKVGTGRSVQCRQWVFPGDRDMVRIRAAKTAVDTLRRELLGLS